MTRSVYSLKRANGNARCEAGGFHAPSRSTAAPTLPSMPVQDMRDISVDSNVHDRVRDRNIAVSLVVIDPTGGEMVGGLM